MTRVNREYLRSPLLVGCTFFCTIGTNALEVIDSRRVKWWTWSGSNRRPLPCHGSALPAAPQAHSAVPLFSLTGMHSSNQRCWGASNSKDFLIKMEPNGQIFV